MASPSIRLRLRALIGSSSPASAATADAAAAASMASRARIGSSSPAAATATATADAAAAASPTTVSALLRMISPLILPSPPSAATALTMHSSATALTMPYPSVTRMRFRVPSAPTSQVPGCHQSLRVLVTAADALPQPFARKGTYTMPLMFAKSYHTCRRVFPSEIAAVWHPGKGICRFFATLPNPGGSQWDMIYKELSRICKQLLILLEKIVDFLRRMLKDIYYEAKDILVDWLYIIELGLRARAIELLLGSSLWAVSSLLCYMLEGTPWETLFELPTEDTDRIIEDARNMMKDSRKLLENNRKMLENNRKILESINKLLEGITKMLVQNEALVTDVTVAMDDLKEELDRVSREEADKSNKIAELERRVVDLEGRI